MREVVAATSAEERTATSPPPRTMVPAEHYLQQCPDEIETKKPDKADKPGRKPVARTCNVCAVRCVEPRKHTKWKRWQRRAS
ncbi:hypothetical protein P3T76_011701 [Phytophthora citrophthora]|uniref:Uncharacterized protein n=1 Tax=Phytophthora citrophthora TaxID=4793 RepID=A0AAD9G8N7_9STRA|nr:hypothetical protein P3T76_011701 [Phytophthora citrophthora]